MQDVIRSYGDGDLDDLTLVMSDEVLRLGQLRSLSIWTDPATDHRGGRLTGTAEVLELDARLGLLKCPGEMVGVTVTVIGIGTDIVRVPAGQGITQRQVIGRRWRIRGRSPGRCHHAT